MSVLNPKEYSPKQVWNIAIPVFISLLTQNIIGVTDTAFLGRLGEVALGGASMGAMIYFCVFTLGFGLSTGTQIIIARKVGRQVYNEVGQVLGQSAMMLLFAAVVLVLLGEVWGALFFKKIFSSGAVAQAASDYWNYRIWGYFPAFGAALFRCFYVGISRTKVLTYNSLAMAVVNIVLDYALIFGHWGFPALGVKGAAIGSVMAELASFTFFLIYTCKKGDRKMYGITWKAMLTPVPPLARVILQLSIYIMLQALVSTLSWAFFFVFIEKLGEQSLAVATIIRSVYIFVYMPVIAYGTAVSTTVSQLIGAGHSSAINGYIRMVRRMSFATMFGIAMVIGLLPKLFLSIFTDDQQLITGALPVLYVILLALLVCSVGQVYFVAVSATGATKMALYMEVVLNVGYLLYTVWAVYGHGGPVALCFAVEIWYYIFIGFVSYRFVTTGRWQDKRWARLEA